MFNGGIHLVAAPGFEAEVSEGHRPFIVDPFVPSQIGIYAVGTCLDSKRNKALDFKPHILSPRILGLSLWDPETRLADSKRKVEQSTYALTYVYTCVIITASRTFNRLRFPPKIRC